MTDHGDGRDIDIAVLSDIHLGTVSCRAREVLDYLRGIRPRMLVLNGDIVDVRRFSPGRWRPEHSAVVDRIMEMAGAGCAVHYVLGNHEHALRAYPDLCFGGIRAVESVDLEIGGKRTGFFHGDVFDHGRNHGTVASALNDVIYDGIAACDRAINRVRASCGRSRWSLIGALKTRLPPAAAYIGRFEDACLAAAAKRGYDAIVCGHIHQPRIRTIQIAGRDITYLNSGDWVESGTALECDAGLWRVVRAGEGCSHAAAAYHGMEAVSAT